MAFRNGCNGLPEHFRLDAAQFRRTFEAARERRDVRRRRHGISGESKLFDLVCSRIKSGANDRPAGKLFFSRKLQLLDRTRLPRGRGRIFGG
jgi:hypothetical protein